MVVAFQIPPWRIIIRDSLEVADNVPNGVPPEISFVKPVFITFFFEVVNSDAGHGFGTMVAGHHAPKVVLGLSTSFGQSSASGLIRA